MIQFIRKPVRIKTNFISHSYMFIKVLTHHSTEINVGEIFFDLFCFWVWAINYCSLSSQSIIALAQEKVKTNVISSP